MASTLPAAETFVGTTRYQTALTVHSGQPACPTPGDGSLPSWYPAGPDDTYEYCCRTQYGAGYVETLTSGLGPGGTTLTACCQRSFICTGAAPFVFDWSMSTEVVTVPGRSFVRPTIVTLPVANTAEVGNGGGGGNGGLVTAIVTATVTVTQTPATAAGGGNGGSLSNADFAGIIIGVAAFIAAVFTLHAGYRSARVRPILVRLHLARPLREEEPEVVEVEGRDQP